MESSKLPVGKWRVSSDNMADYKWYARIRDYFKSQWDDSLLESKLPKTPMKTEKTSETLLNEYDSIKKEIDSLRENAMKKIKNGEDTGDLIPRIKELQTKEESIYNEYKSKRNIEEWLDESNRKIESDKVIEDKKITEMKKSEETDLRWFTDNMSPMEKGKAISLLTNKRVMYKGKAMTLRDAFEKKLEDWWKLSDNWLIFRNPEYLSHTVDVGTPVNKTESAYIKYISKSDTPKTPQEGKTVDDLIAKRQEGTKWTYAKELQQEELNFQNKIKDSLLKNNWDMNKVSKDFWGQMSADWGKAQKTMRDWFSDEYGFYWDTGKKKLSDFLESFKKKSSLPLSQKSEVKYSEPIEDNLAPVIKATEESRYIVKKPFNITKNVYRWVWDSGGSWFASYWQWLYTTTNKSIAKEYAWKSGKILDISKWQLPENPLQFKTVMDYGNWLDYDVQKKLWMKASEFNAKYPDVWEFIKSLWHDWVVIWNWEIMVTYP